MGANLVSTVRSFLPFVSKSGDTQPQPAAGKKPVKVSTSSRELIILTLLAQRLLTPTQGFVLERAKHVAVGCMLCTAALYCTADCSTPAFCWLIALCGRECPLHCCC
jgi:hypothetical protein